MALIGPSGCGKSTFLRLLNRMNDLIEGTRHTGDILLDGEDIYGRGVDLVDLRRRVGMVFQKSNPFPKSVFENVVFGPRVAGLRHRGRLDEIAERCLRGAALWDEVKDRLDDSALDLSGGQQQRLCIARALATDPEVLLMDEPASALDPASTARIEDLIFELKRNYTIVIVTHNMQQAARVSDLTAFFFQGRLIEAGPDRPAVHAAAGEADRGLHHGTVWLRRKWRAGASACGTTASRQPRTLTTHDQTPGTRPGPAAARHPGAGGLGRRGDPQGDPRRCKTATSHLAQQVIDGDRRSTRRRTTSRRSA